MAGRRSSLLLSLALLSNLLCICTLSSRLFIAPGQLRGSRVATRSNLLASGSFEWEDAARSREGRVPMQFFGGGGVETTTPAPPPEEESIPLIYIVLVLDVLVYAADKSGLITVPGLHEYWAKF
eukprot:TRINITY_DN68309_c0_g1_i1.p1 TRINITY_DN68309_c0_g1~~TRINITY_DN68309_c0_g1_i1.p1  ORF type:complete len:124 (+),score=14.86 TRINITY_DN68309_c0_g1_i1:60-431(+)